MYKHKKELLQKLMATMSKSRRIMHSSSAISPEDKLTSILQIQGLAFLKKHPKATVGELAAELIMSSPVIAKFTERLVNLGWVQRENDPDDRRVIRLLITSSGEKELKAMHERHFEKMSKIFSLMPEKDLIELTRIMENLTKNWEEMKK